MVKHNYHNGPATVKSIKCKIGWKSGSSRPDFSLESAQTHFSGQLLSRFHSEIRPGWATFYIDFTCKRYYSCQAIKNRDSPRSFIQSKVLEYLCVLWVRLMGWLQILILVSNTRWSRIYIRLFLRVWVSVRSAPLFEPHPFKRVLGPRTKTGRD